MFLTTSVSIYASDYVKFIWVILHYMGLYSMLLFHFKRYVIQTDLKRIPKSRDYGSYLANRKPFSHLRVPENGII